MQHANRESALFPGTDYIITLTTTKKRYKCRPYKSAQQHQHDMKQINISKGHREWKRGRLQKGKKLEVWKRRKCTTFSLERLFPVLPLAHLTLHSCERCKTLTKQQTALPIINMWFTT